MALRMPEDFVEKARALVNAAPDGAGPFGAEVSERMSFVFTIGPGVMALMTAADRVPEEFPPELARVYRRIGLWSLLRAAEETPGEFVPDRPEKLADEWPGGWPGDCGGDDRTPLMALALSIGGCLGDGLREIRLTLDVLASDEDLALLSVSAQVWGGGGRMVRIGRPIKAGWTEVPFGIGADALVDKAAALLGCAGFPAEMREFDGPEAEACGPAGGGVPCGAD
ncbi:MAG: hypothetical protein LBR80_01700 [Deltaproteobacteria bacterium]|jgi:hypothetical protein|nr:hypothetical protein [Deltaproteobacteria bacterium]